MIKWDEPSTKRGAVWLIGGLIAALCSFVGKGDPIQIMAITASVAGGMGLTVSDKQPIRENNENI